MTATTDTSSTEADRALKAKHRSVWASGDYPTLAQDLIWTLGPTLVEASDVRSGQLVLDVAAGSGNVAIPAAERGANVVASDLTPELFDAGRRIAAERGVEIDWREADAEALPFPDSAFDAVLSCVGVMFAPHHKDSADELVRVLRPGGTLGLLSWTPQGFIGQLFATMKPFSPPPPAGAQPPPLWGDEEHVRALLGDRVTDVSAERRSVTVTHFPGTTDFREYFASHYGPTMATYAFNATDPDRVAALDEAIDALAARFTTDGVMEWEYLLLTATRT
jgi:ubiquinone/menaquinone biosynthesis C-methylase UbiE